MAVGVRPRRVGFEKDRGVLDVQGQGGVAFLRVDLDSTQPPAASAIPVLRLLAERGVATRFVRLYPDCLSFVAAKEQLAAVLEALEAAGLPYQASAECAVVAVIAPNMRSIPGLMARVGDVLDRGALEVYQTADSHSSVACVVPGDGMADAVAALRGEFGLAEDVVK